jgi:3-oxoacyl-[acyl-carrier protein] reductase
MGYLEERAGLAGKVALVAGGGGGLGRAIAVDFARAGVRLALCDRNNDLLEATSDMVGQYGDAAFTATVDVRDADAFARFFADVVDHYGRVDVLVNVVGGTFKADFLDTNPKGWEAIMRANFAWLLTSTQLAARQMRSQGGGGSIINLTSIEAHRAAPGYAVYAGMKGAVTQFSRTLAVELAPYGIRVNSIAPDMVPTEGMPVAGQLASIPDAEARGSDATTHEEALRIAIPMGREGTYEDVGGCALFLASDLSTYVTGTTLHPDGGAYASSGWFNWPGLGFANVPPAAAVQASEDRR